MTTITRADTYGASLIGKKAVANGYVFHHKNIVPRFASDGDALKTTLPLDLSNLFAICGDFIDGNGTNKRMVVVIDENEQEWEAPACGFNLVEI